MSGGKNGRMEVTQGLTETLEMLQKNLYGAIMGRIRTNITVGNRPCWTLFDNGSRNTYIISKAADSLAVAELTQPIKARLGGKVHKIRKTCVLEAVVEDHWVSTHARVIDEIGKDEEDKEIEVLFGALAMQEWGIRLVPDEERLDMTHYPEEFIEF